MTGMLRNQTQLKFHIFLNRNLLVQSENGKCRGCVPALGKSRETRKASKWFEMTLTQSLKESLLDLQK